MTENKVTGKAYRILTDKANEIYDRVSFWTHATDVEMENGKNLQEELSSTIDTINGTITNKISALERTLNSTITNRLSPLETQVNTNKNGIASLNTNLGRLSENLNSTNVRTHLTRGRLVYTINHPEPVQKDDVINFGILRVFSRDTYPVSIPPDNGFPRGYITPVSILSVAGIPRSDGAPIGTIACVTGVQYISSANFHIVPEFFIYKSANKIDPFTIEVFVSYVSYVDLYDGT